jgi:AcrR family transcriptional regulator
LKAAQECFAQSGYDATGVAEICRRAGLSKGAFYHHFPSKQAVFFELLNDWLIGVDAQMTTFRAEMPTVPEGLMRMAVMVRPVFDAAGKQLPMFLEFLSQAARDQDIWKATIAPYRKYRAYFAEMLEEGIAEGSLKSVDPQIASQVVVSLAVGLVLQGVLDPEGADWGLVAQEGIRMILDGIQSNQETKV